MTTDDDVYRGDAMSSRPRLLDLFCGAGGAAMGYHRAGFDVVGVDIAPQPHYPFQFLQKDALDVLDEVIDGDWRGFDAIHASPPCQDHSWASNGYPEHGTGWMLSATIDRLRRLSLPWVVENVVGPTVVMDGWWFVLCGTMFGHNLLRHRRFGSNLLMLAPGCRHDLHPLPVTVVGHGPPKTARTKWMKETGHTYYQADCREAMGIDWMNRGELAQAIPPFYTEWIGAHLIKALEVAA